MEDSIYLFDLDGTITDSGPGIMNSVRYALKKFGIDHPEEAKLRRFVGPPLTDSFQRYFDLSPRASRQAVAYYREYYTAGGIYENEVYPEIPEVLSSIRELGGKIYLATSKPQVFAQQILEHFQLTPFFDGVVGSFLDGTRIDKAEVIAQALKQAGVTGENRSRVWMTGDTRYDILGAHAQGIRGVGALYGYGTREELLEAGADFLIRTPKELLDRIRNK